jgi:hypothetical protein
MSLEVNLHIKVPLFYEKGNISNIGKDYSTDGAGSTAYAYRKK